MLGNRKIYNKSDLTTDVFLSLFMLFVCSFAMGSLTINHNAEHLRMSSHYWLIFITNFSILIVLTFRIWSKLSRFFTMKDTVKMKGIFSFLADKDGNYSEGTFKVEIFFLFCIINVVSFHLGSANELLNLKFIDLFVFALFILTLLFSRRICNVFDRRYILAEN